MSVGGIESILPRTATASLSPLSGTEASTGTSGPSGPQFGQMLVKGLEGLESLQDKTDGLAVQAATGDLRDVHDYMIAAQEASVATEVVVTLKNKAVEAFTEIMRMPI